MSYDFVLFAPDGDPGSARVSKSALTERIDFAEPQSTAVLTELETQLIDAAPLPLRVDPADVHVSGDRCLYVGVR